MLLATPRRVKKLLFFAHTPPPYHGQSLMVEQLLNALGGDARRPSRSASPQTEFACYHVNCRFSETVEAIGRVRPKKILLVLNYCVQAIWCRFRYGAKNFLYVPAPPLRSAIYRDWVIMAICRPFFRTRVFYWQGAGLSDWLSSGAKAWERRITRILLGRPALSIVLAESNRRDAHELESEKVEVVPNFIPDPCPEFERAVRPLRLARQAARQKIACGETVTRAEMLAADGAPHVFRILFIGLCTRSKGLFDAIEAVAIVHRTLTQRCSALRLRLEVAGAFWRPQERQEFEQRICQPDLLAADASAGDACIFERSEPESLVGYHGFVSGEQKRKLMTESDCFCFPTFYRAESFGLVLIEAMAFDLPIIATNWRMIPEILPQAYPGIVEPQSPAQIASAILSFMTSPPGCGLRAHFLSRYTDIRCIERLKATLSDTLTKRGR